MASLRHGFVRHGFKSLSDALGLGRNDPRPQPFTLKLEPGVDPFAARGPPTMSARLREKYAISRPPAFEEEREDDP